MVHIMRVRAVSSGWTGGPGLNTWYFQTPTLADPVTADATTVVARVRAGIFAARTLWPSAWTSHVETAVDVFDSATGDLVDSLTATGVSDNGGGGGASFGPIPAALCVNIRTLTFISGRRVQGRAFLSPLALTDDADGSPTSVQIASAQLLINTLRDFGGSGPELVVWHRPVAGAGGQAAAALGELCADKFAVLRSRRD